MGGISIWQLAIVGILVVLLFGRGKISELMGDVAKGIKSFKKGMKDDDDTEADVAGRVTTDHVQADGSAADPIDVTPRKEREGA
jgi:sec-independent protein translocase protein TatA